jgi:hypothetical protein
MTSTITKTKQQKFLLGVLIMLGAVSFVPSASAQTTASYIPQNNLEFIAYLQGIVDTLEAQVGAGTNTSGGSSRVSSFTPNVSLATRAELKAEFDARSSSVVYAWFEYGEGSRLNNKTSRTRLTVPRSGEVEHTRTLTSLKNNVQYSYRPVFELSNGSKFYGAVRTFGTPGTELNPLPGTGGLTGGGTVSNSRGTLAIDGSTYKVYDQVTVSFTVPRSRTDSGNIIGLYKVGDSNRNRELWRYTGKREEGELTFKIKTAGTYEFRMFYAGSSSAVVTSNRIVVQ